MLSQRLDAQGHYIVVTIAFRVAGNMQDHDCVVNTLFKPQPETPDWTYQIYYNKNRPRERL